MIAPSALLTEDYQTMPHDAAWPVREGCTGAIAYAANVRRGRIGTMARTLTAT
ncbi:hypothetical protein [uncultured Hyphomonas sp.]|uniref:hypothetical protein n=1 Tax=uncultured Hyphomonas sp. TaxID=225298 RepID=UPI002615F788|nr:hypothetical protein [uncultured Hyphomonas sp.]